MTKINPDHYTYRVMWSEEDGEFVARCAEFASLSHLAAKPEAALRGMTALVRDVIEDMLATDATPPVPFSQREYSGKFMLRVPPQTHRRLSIEAAEQNVSLNRLIAAKL